LKAPDPPLSCACDGAVLRPVILVSDASITRNFERAEEPRKMTSVPSAGDYSDLR